MENHHLEGQELERLEAGELSQAETTEISRHLIHCARCRQVLDRLGSEAAGLLKALLHDLAREGLLSPSGVAPTVRRSFPAGRRIDKNRVAMEIERRRPVDPESLSTELSSMSPAEAHARIVQHPDRYHGTELAECLLAKSWQARTDDPLASEEWSRISLELLTPDDDFEDPARRHDLVARAWSLIANSFRIRFKMAEAQKAFEVAEQNLAQGTRDPRQRAQVLSMKGVMLYELHRFDEAQRHFDQAAAIHRWAGDVEGEVRCRISKANAFELAGDLDQTIATLEKAAQLAPPDSDIDPYLLTCIQHNRALCLVQTGRAEEARRLLPELRKSMQRDGMRVNRIRLRWLEARVARELGETGRAEELLRRVRDGFLREDMSLGAAIASLDLAALLLDGGRTAETRELAKEMVRIFNSLDVQREAFAALILFQQAALRDQASAQMVRDIASYLERSRTCPTLRYEKPS